MRFLYSLLIFSMITTNSWSVQESSQSAQNTYKDIKETLGSVPSFFKEFPESGIEGAWQDMKGIQLNSQTAIPAKYKELIGLAAAAQIPCRYCVYFHRKAAQLNKASPDELKEAVAMAAEVRRWSAVLTGLQMDMQEFRTEVDRLFSTEQKNIQAMEQRPMALKDIKTPNDAYTDMKNTFGFVPSWFKNYPQSGIVGVWKEMRGVEANPDTAIPGKYKQLIALAVAAQTPCPYCVYYHSKAAVSQGATQEELKEAIAMSGITREWSTVLNGTNLDDKKFQMEVDKVMKHLQAKSKKVTSAQ